MGAVHLNGSGVDQTHLGTQFPQDLQNQGNVADLGNILNAACAVHQQCGGQDSHGGVFGAADLDGSVQAVSATDLVFVQRSHLS